MTAVHQFVPTLLPRDATGDHTLALRDTLRRAGWDSEIYVEAAHDELQHEATYFERYAERAQPGDILLYQLSTASPVAEFLLGRPEPLVLDYHNITPTAFYDGWEDDTGEKVALARRQARRWRRVPPWASPIPRSTPPIWRPWAAPTQPSCPSWSRSRGRAGGRRKGAGPAGGQPRRRHRAPVRRAVLSQQGPASSGRGPVALPALVRPRRPAPSGRPEGDGALCRRGVRLRRGTGPVHAVHHRSDLSPAELAAWYDDADVFVCLSEHEGFCIPLLEAMHAGLPIVALAPVPSRDAR